jgi:predicted amidophosphoribosyltransferase
MEATKCPSCGKPKKAWFKLCYECNEKEKQKPTCEVCGIEVPEGHFLCKPHWQERQDEKKDLNKLKYVKTRKEQEFKEKFEGKYYSNTNHKWI